MFVTKKKRIFMLGPELEGTKRVLVGLESQAGRAAFVVGDVSM